MRAFKIMAMLCLCVYFCALIFINILTKLKINYLSHVKEKTFEKLVHSNINLPRIIIFGSSHCDVGLNAKDITEAIGISTYNFCHAAWESDAIYFNKILEHLNAKDYLIYAKRIDFEKRTGFIKIDNNFFERLTLIPWLRNNVNELISFLSVPGSIDEEKYREDGDRIKFDLELANNYPDYILNYSTINENLEFQLKNIAELTNHNLEKAPKVIAITAPILIKNVDLLDSRKIQAHLDKHPNVLAWIPPIITDRQEYFSADLFHVNETGRAVWTAQLIHELKRIIK